MMNFPLKALFLALPLACLSYGQTAAATAPPVDKAAAYYNFSMGHLYAELAGVYGNRSEYVGKAIDYYKQALKLDPGASFLFEELTDLYIQSGRLKDAVTEAEDILKREPNNLDARRILGRIYTRMIGDTQQGKINEEMLRAATEQYEKITAKDPKDIESWLTLGRLYRTARNSVDAEKAYSQALAIDASNEDALTGLAIVYSDVGDTKKAIEKLQAVTNKDPNPRTLAALATAYEQLHDYRSAAEVLRKAIDLDPENSRIKRALAYNLLNSNNLDESLKYYKEFADDDPHDSEALLRMAEIYREKRDFTKARESLDKAKAADPENLEVRYEEVNLLAGQAQTDKAIETLKAILKDTERKTYSESEKGIRLNLMERLGDLYRGANQTQAAVDTFRQMADLDPDSAAKAEGQIVDTYRAAKDFKNALAEANAAIKKYPDDEGLKRDHAFVLADSGKVDQAVSELRALLKGEHDRETQLAIAEVYERAKRYEDIAKPLDAAEKLSETKPEKVAIYFMRGAMYERLKQFDASEAEFRKVLELDPDSPGALNYLGYMLADRGVRLDEAQKMIVRALELDPDNGAYLDSLGWVYYRQNRLDDAEQALVRALSKSGIGQDPTVHDHLGDVYLKLGKTKDAITQWQASLKEAETDTPSDMEPGELAQINKKLEGAKVRLARETGASK
ncbi:MAG TPA: tetratricopeptide repeat protein [Bryobacteraceae bacterium]|jgi:tetratricopeptide (TPR) repeat protein|nr:tetratricopeptide repeat protein [Bryobacteraceae bacterium]